MNIWPALGLLVVVMVWAVNGAGEGAQPTREFTVYRSEPIFNPRHACKVYGSCRVCVCVCVCLSVKRHLTSGASVCPGNAVMYFLAGNQGQKICSVFSKTHAFQRSRTPSLEWPYIRLAIFPADNTHAHCAYTSCRVHDGCSML